MNKQLLLAKCHPEEFQALIQLKDRCIDASGRIGFKFWDRTYPSSEDIRNRISKGSLHSFRLEDLLIGCVNIDDKLPESYRSGKWKFNSFAVINMMMIDPLHQGKGYARKALKQIERFLSSRGIESIRLSVYIENHPARRLYEKSEFVRRGTIELSKGLCYLFEKKIG